MDEEGAFCAGFPENSHRCGFAGNWSHIHGTESWDATPSSYAVLMMIALIQVSRKTNATTT
jgi:hypothetical protein